jgi:energy-coupling factor transporter transmembrane protein EcfT
MGEINELIAKFAGTDLATNTLGASVTIFGIYTLYFFLAAAIFVTLLFPLLQMLKDFKSALGVLFGVAALFLVFMFCYWLSSAEPFTVLTADGPSVTSAETMRAVEACIYMLYFMLCAAILSVALAPLVSYFKK